jgi:hypothetical protein
MGITRETAMQNLRDVVEAAIQELGAAADCLDDDVEADETREIADRLLECFDALQHVLAAS